MILLLYKIRIGDDVMLNGLYFKIALFCLNKVSKVKYWQYETPTGGVNKFICKKR